MGKHVGWVVNEVGNRFLARAWDPSAKRYANRTHDTRGEATAWAREQSARFAARIETAAPSATRQLAADLVSDLRRRGRVPAHVDDVEAVLTRYAREVPDLSHPRAAINTADWLASHVDLSPTTRNKYLVYLRAMCRRGVRSGALLRDPLAMIGREKAPRALKPQFSLVDLRTMAGAIDDPFYLRFALMFYAGLRAQEAHNLTWGDIDFAGQTISVRLGDYALKGDRERIVPLQPALAKALQSQREQWQPAGGCGAPANWLLFPPRVARLHGAQHGRDLHAFCARLKISADRSPHSLRHSYAGLMTATGVPSILLAAYMGHASTATTAGYAQMAAAYSRAVEHWPRGEFRLI